MLVFLLLRRLTRSTRGASLAATDAGSTSRFQRDYGRQARSVLPILPLPSAPAFCPHLLPPPSAPTFCPRLLPPPSAPALCPRPLPPPSAAAFCRHFLLLLLLPIHFLLLLLLGWRSRGSAALRRAFCGGLAGWSGPSPLPPPGVLDTTTFLFFSFSSPECGATLWCRYMMPHGSPNLCPLARRRRRRSTSLNNNNSVFTIIVFPSVGQYTARKYIAC